MVQYDIRMTIYNNYMQSQLNNIKYNFFFDLKNRDNEINYFRMKQKYGNSFSQEQYEQFNALVLGNIMSLLSDIDTLVVPETGNNMLLEIAKTTNKNIFILEKNSKEDIIAALSEQTMMRSEKIKLMTMLEGMDTIKMAQLAGNQRKRFVDCLFKKPNSDTLDKLGSIALLDDSVFSGYTFMAANSALQSKQKSNIILFSKID